MLKYGCEKCDGTSYVRIDSLTTTDCTCKIAMDRYKDLPLWYRWLDSCKRRHVLSVMLFLMVGSALMFGCLWLLFNNWDSPPSFVPWPAPSVSAMVA